MYNANKLYKKLLKVINFRTGFTTDNKETPSTRAVCQRRINRVLCRILPPRTCKDAEVESTSSRLPFHPTVSRPAVMLSSNVANPGRETAVVTREIDSVCRREGLCNNCFLLVEIYL